jgi:predicted metal-dependent hydrolase
MQEFFVDYPPYQIPYQQRTSQKAQRMRLVAEHEHGLVLIVPDGTRNGEIARFLEQNLQWMFYHWRRYERLRNLHRDHLLPLSKRPVIWYLGREYRLSYAHEEGRASVHFDGEQVVVKCFDEADGKRTLERWYRTQAKAVIGSALVNWAAEMKVSYGEVVYRDQKTRWGSCSTTGDLNFNWRLIMAPMSVLNYVVIHELAHRKEMNHSVRFWKIVERYCADYKKQQDWLKKNTLMLRT